jgi:predicted acylesterase/phospholipase RssA
MRWSGQARRRAREPVVGLVLSGGGSRASFQIGALTYLYDRVGITPTVIAGASVGSMPGAVLAQSADHDGQRRALTQLEHLWREMRQSSDIFLEREWFARLLDRGPIWRDTIAGIETRRRALPLVHALNHTTSRAVDPHEPAPGSAPGVVELITGVWAILRARPDLSTVVQGVRDERSFYRLGPVVDRVLDRMYVPGRVAGSGVTLRIAVVALESGELRYVSEAGQLLDEHDVPVPGAEPIDLVEAVRASCAIPAAFAPVRLDDEHYVDGGVREALPAAVVLEHHHVDRCYAVVAAPPGVAREESFADKDLLAIVLRSTAGIMSDEVLRNEVAYARAAGAVVIDPELDIHDALTVDPGLTAIAMDYGYARAAEVVEGATATERQLTRGVFELRRRTWAKEVDLFGPPRPDAAGLPVGTDPSTLVALKRELRDAVGRVPTDRLPPEAPRWWEHYERHPFAVPEARPWAPAAS